MIAQFKEVFVEQKKWITEEELLEIITIAESTPGPIAINMATYIGYKQKKILGSIFSTLGVVLPSFIIIFIISLFIEEFMSFKVVKYAFVGINVGVSFLILKTGIGMFNGCPIDVASIENITTSLPNLSEVDFNNDDYWSYQLNDNSVITEPNKRGIITFNVPYSLSSNEDYIKTVNPYLNSLYSKKWKVERNIPFYYDKSFFIEIEIKKSGEWDRDLHAFLNFKFTRNAGEEFKFTINDGEEVNPNVVLLDAHGKVSPYEGSVRHSFYKNFIPSHINATEDDCSGSATYSLIAVSLFQGMSFRFNLTAEGTDLKLTCANFRDDARVYIDGVLQNQQ